jgi:hypothetical protein
MKVNADIYCVHSASFQSQVMSTVSLPTRGKGGACFITSSFSLRPSQQSNLKVVL